MFKKAKRKIVLSILAILGAVLVGTLGMVYLASYLSVTAQDYQVLSEHSSMLANDLNFRYDDSLNGKMPNDTAMQNAGSPGRGKIQRHLELGTFYTVAISEDGTASVLENGAEDIYTDEELISYARKIGTRKKGRAGELLYLVTEAQETTLVCFMDNAVFADSFNQLFLFTLLFGIIAMAAIAFISARIADRIVSPMEQTYQKQKQFTADAGHELKTPIAAMAANIELLHREIGQNEWLENITYENERMRDLVTELLELARNENKTAEKKPTDLSHLVNSVILPLEATAFEKNILIESDIPDGITAETDEKSIRQLVTILVDNAISHTERTDSGNGKISASLSEAKGTVRFSVSNPGEEIPKEEQEKLFERFYRSDASHEFTGHYGLGLAIAKAIAEANNAKITVSCRNGFVTFTVELPIK